MCTGDPGHFSFSDGVICPSDYYFVVFEGSIWPSDANVQIKIGIRSFSRTTFFFPKTTEIRSRLSEWNGPFQLLLGCKSAGTNPAY